MGIAVYGLLLHVMTAQSQIPKKFGACVKQGWEWKYHETKKAVISGYYSFFEDKVTPSGFEPKSSEPESEILSIELWGRNGCKSKDIFGIYHEPAGRKAIKTNPGPEAPRPQPLTV
jgi:hypothetical protein